MKEDLKLCMKLLKYSYNQKDETFTGIVMFILGLILFLVDSIAATLAIGPSIFIVLAPPLFIKGIYSLPYSYMVCSSKKRRFMELTFPNIWTACSTFFGYTLWILMVRVFLLAGSPEREAEIARWIMWSALLYAVMLIFYGITTRFYWRGLIFIVVAALAVMFGEIFWDEGFSNVTEFWPAAVAGLMITMAGVLLSCVLRVLVYKKPVVRGRIGKQMLGLQ